MGLFISFFKYCFGDGYGWLCYPSMVLIWSSAMVSHQSLSDHKGCQFELCKARPRCHLFAEPMKLLFSNRVSRQF